MKNRFVYEICVVLKDDPDGAFKTMKFSSVRQAEGVYGFLEMIPGFNDHYVVVMNGHLVAKEDF